MTTPTIKPSLIVPPEPATCAGPNCAPSALPEWMNTPEKRRAIWAAQALAAALCGDIEKAEDCGRRAKAEDAKCTHPLYQNTEASNARERGINEQKS